MKLPHVKVGSHLRIEVHTAHIEKKPNIKFDITKILAPRLPRGVTVRFVVWNERDLGEKFHARYFLTDRGGIEFEAGLDTGKPGESTNVFLLNNELYERRWAQFQSDSRTYELVEEFTVVGTASSR